MDIRRFTKDEVFELASTLYWNENLEPGQQWKLFVLDINKSEVSGTKRVCCAKIKFYGSMYQFEANKTEYQSGETMTINFKGAPAEPNHQIAIFPKGVRDTSYLDGQLATLSRFADFWFNSSSKGFLSIP